MNRIIKFRVWDAGREEMWFPSNDTFISFHSGDGKIPWAVYHDDGSRRITGDPYAILNTPGNLMQFTGLLDKNGKEIYEGDIVRMLMPFVNDTRYANYEVIFNMVELRFSVKDWPKHSVTPFIFGPEIIGNIYEK